MRALLLAFEGEARPMAHLAARLKASGNAVLVVSCDHFNVTHSRGEVFDYYRECGLRDEEFSTLDEVFRSINALPMDLSRDQVDWQYLTEFETRYGLQFGLMELASMDPMMSGAFHHRDIYFRPENHALLHKFLELLARWMEGLFGQSGFDVVFTVNFQYFVKALAFSMAKSLGTPFVMVGTCRISDFYLAYENFSLGTPKAVLDEMARLEASGSDCAEAAEYMESMIQSRKPAYTDFERTLEDLRARWRLGTRIGELWRILTRYPKSVLLVHKHYRGLLRRSYFLPGYFALVRAMSKAIWRRFSYFRHASLNDPSLPRTPFVYFPLHLIPENSVLTLSHTRNELECLFQLSKALPIGWEVVVKVNPSMLNDFDTHPNAYYLEMAELPNVRFVSPLIPSAAILAHARGVACISGTALFEAAVYGLPAFRWGRTEFEVIDTVFEFDRVQLRDQLNCGPSRNLKYYIQACMNVGMHLDMRVWNLSLAQEGSPEQRLEFERQLSLMESAIQSRARPRAMA